MFKHRECMGHLVGGAAIGVAVGMLIQKMLSPRSSPTPETNEDSASSIRFEYVENNAGSNNLQVPLHRHKHRRYRRHSCSKSVSKSKHAREESGYLSVSPHSLRKSKLSVSESDLRSSSETDGESSKRNFEKLEQRKNPGKATGDVDKSRDTEFFLNTCKEYSPLMLKDCRNSTYIVEKDFDLNSFRESFTRESTEYLPLTSKDREEVSGTPKDDSLNSFHGSFATESTEYLAIRRKSDSQDPGAGSLLFDINNRKSRVKNRNVTFWIGGFEDEEISNCSVTATCDMEDKSGDFDSYCEDRANIEAVSK